MDMNTQIAVINTFSLENPDFYANISKATNGDLPFNTMYKMANNPFLTHTIYDEIIICDKYFNLDDAFANLNNGSILLIVEELGIFCIFSNLIYYALLCKNLYVGDNNGKRYHITLTDGLKRVTYLINASLDVDNIVKICKDEISKDTSTYSNKDYTTIIAKIFDNDDIFREFAYCEKLHDIIANSKSNTIDSGVNHQLNTGNTPNNTKGNNNIAKTMRENKAKKWINANLPTDGMNSQEYYNNYKSSPQEKHIRLDMFNEIVSNHKYIKVLSGERKQIWKKI
jgi:hypothetical protein